MAPRVPSGRHTLKGRTMHRIATIACSFSLLGCSGGAPPPVDGGTNPMMDANTAMDAPIAMDAPSTTDGGPAATIVNQITVSGFPVAGVLDDSNHHLFVSLRNMLGQGAGVAVI